MGDSSKEAAAPPAKDQSWEDVLISLFKPKMPSLPHFEKSQGFHPDDERWPERVLANPPYWKFRDRNAVKIQPRPGADFDAEILKPLPYKKHTSLVRDHSESNGEFLVDNIARGAVLGAFAHASSVMLLGNPLEKLPRRHFVPWYRRDLFHLRIKTYGYVLEGSMWGATGAALATTTFQTIHAMRGCPDRDPLAYGAAGASIGAWYGVYRGMWMQLFRVGIPAALLMAASQVEYVWPELRQNLDSHLPVAYADHEAGKILPPPEETMGNWPPAKWTIKPDHTWKPPPVHQPGELVRLD